MQHFFDIQLVDGIYRTTNKQYRLITKPLAPLDEYLTSFMTHSFPGSSLKISCNMPANLKIQDRLAIP